MQYTGLYSDITLPAKVNATVTLLNDKLVIVPEGSSQSIEWFYGVIRKKKQKKNSLTLIIKSPLSPELILTDPGILTEIEKVAPYAPVTHPPQWYQSRNGLYSMFAVKIGTGVLAVLIYFFAVPYIVDFVVNRITPKAEANIGRKIKEAFINTPEIDTTETRLLNQFYHHLTPPGKRQVHITVINSPIKNACSIPGNEIVVYSNIISVMNTYPEMVALIGHEGGHAEYRHSLKMLCRQSSTSIVLLTLTGNMNGVLNVIVDNAASLGNLSYSRGYESDADKFGYDWMKKNKVNPEGMIDLFDHLNDEATINMNIDFISNHPSLPERISDVKGWIKKDGKPDFIIDTTLQKKWEQIKGALSPQK